MKIFILVGIAIFLKIVKFFSTTKIPVSKLENISTISYVHDVPKLIFRCSKNNTMNLMRKEHCYDKWIRLNPNFHMIYFNDKTQEEFIRNKFPQAVYEAYKTLIPGAYKSDLFRLCVLYQYGGVYVDEYAEPFTSLANMMRNCVNTQNRTFISVLDCAISGGGIHNGFIISSRAHPFLKRAIEKIVNNVKIRFYGKNPLDPTGPLCLGNAIKEICSANTQSHRDSHHSHGNSSFREGWNRSGPICYYLYTLEWGPYQNIYKHDQKILRKKYSILEYFVQKFFRKKYSDAWYNRKIYK